MTAAVGAWCFGILALRTMPGLSEAGGGWIRPLSRGWSRSAGFWLWQSWGQSTLVSIDGESRAIAPPGSWGLGDRAFFWQERPCGTGALETWKKMSISSADCFDQFKIEMSATQQKNSRLTQHQSCRNRLKKTYQLGLARRFNQQESGFVSCKNQRLSSGSWALIGHLIANV